MNRVLWMWGAINMRHLQQNSEYYFIYKQQRIDALLFVFLLFVMIGEVVNDGVGPV